MKSKLALERDKFILSKEGKELCEGVPHGIYLQNRIEKAFLAGIKVGEASQPVVEADAGKCAFCDMNPSVVFAPKFCGACGRKLHTA